MQTESEQYPSDIECNKKVVWRSKYNDIWYTCTIVLIPLNKKAL